jgi:hypothetical protein
MFNSILIRTLLIYSADRTVSVVIVFGAHFFGIVISLVLSLTLINRSLFYSIIIIIIYLFIMDVTCLLWYLLVCTSIRYFEDNLGQLFV